MNRASHRRRAFSLIELVIVVVIIAIIGAIAIPRMSRGAAGAADAALKANLLTLRRAVDLYAVEHGGTFPEFAKIVNQLTLFSDNQGDTSTTKDSTHIFGPYLRTIPPLPVGIHKDLTEITDNPAADSAWVYDESTGKIITDTTVSETDSRGIKYTDY